MPSCDNGRALAVQLYDARQHTGKAICTMLRISKPTLYKCIDAARSQMS